MKTISRSLFVCLFLLGITKATPGDVPADQPRILAEIDTTSVDDRAPISYEQLYNQLINLTANPRRVATVNDFTFQRDVARFNLLEGELYLLSPVRNHTVAAFFIGKGSFSFTPPTEIEKGQLYRFYQTKSLVKEFKSLFLLFADYTLVELEQNLTFNAGKIEKGVKKDVKHCLEYLSDKKRKYFNTEVMKTLFDNEKNGFFYAHISEEKSQPIFFKINPFATEEVSFMRRAKVKSLDKIPEVICQFHKQEDYPFIKDTKEDQKDFLRVNHYKIESTITDELDFSSVCEVEFQSTKPDQSWIYLSLFADLEVDSVLGEKGGKLNHFKGMENPTLWIKYDPPLSENEVRTFKVFYHGDLIKADWDLGWVYIQSPDWYPRTDNQRSTTFDLIFHTAEEFTLVSVGEQISSQPKVDMVTTHWISSNPIYAASFNLGYYKRYEINTEGIPPITVYMAETGHDDIGRVMNRMGTWTGVDMEKQVGEDITMSLAFFQHVFGECPVDQLSVTETPYFHGLSFPGMIQLSWKTFQRTEVAGDDEIFRAHEVAHQWWGIGVNFNTYHDQWLSEGLSDFAGIWYMQIILKDNKKYFDMLKVWRDDIMGIRKYPFGIGSQEAGPIWLGNRTFTSTTKEDYNLIIYKKGAWVLHMLRNMMIDFKTMDESRFTNMLRDYYSTYVGKRASTEDFQKIVEKHCGMEMDWFFNQWIYGTGIPTYHFSYNTEKTSDSKFVVHCKIEQLDVPDDFQMYVPLYIDFGNDRFVRLRLHIKGPVTELDLPVLPLKPKKIVFNDLESVLCKVKNVWWKK